MVKISQALGFAEAREASFIIQKVVAVAHSSTIGLLGKKAEVGKAGHRD
jgi:hypothetical protein